MRRPARAERQKDPALSKTETRLVGPTAMSSDPYFDQSGPAAINPNADSEPSLPEPPTPMRDFRWNERFQTLVESLDQKVRIVIQTIHEFKKPTQANRAKLLLLIF
jgi:hypothetical protein